MKLQRLQPPRPSDRRGFTLVELLVTIFVIGILIALLLPAIGSVRTRVRYTQLQAEVNRLATAVTSFKANYGAEPPSSIIICEQASDWVTTNTNIARSRALIRQFWPQFDFSYSAAAGNAIDFNGDGDTTDQCTLEPGECLVFFLGGLPVKDTSTTPATWTLRPFTKNAQNPFSLANNANRESAAYDFDASRLVDLDNDGFPEFVDTYPQQRKPILYFSSYDGNGYRLAEFPGVTPSGTFPASPYLAGGSETAQPYNAKSFQIISPGADGEYGQCGPYQPGSNTPLPGWTRTSPPLTVMAADRQVENDNVTNFGNGRLAN